MSDQQTCFCVASTFLMGLVISDWDGAGECLSTPERTLARARLPKLRKDIIAVLGGGDFGVEALKDIARGFSDRCFDDDAGSDAATHDPDLPLRWVISQPSYGRITLELGIPLVREPDLELQDRTLFTWKVFLWELEGYLAARLGR